MSNPAGPCSTPSNMEPFPSWALQPRKETGATAFLTKNPTFDGRGVVIAIFDSGVDPAARGMQVTSDGKPKIVDRFDGSGSGDVDTSTQVDVVEGKVVGLSGRTLTIPETWVNPSGKYRLGVKPAVDLWPRGVKDRVLRERREKMWEPNHKQSLAEAVKKQQESGVKDKDAESLSTLEKLEKENFDAEVELVASLDKKHSDTSAGHWLSDVGPVYDCLVWNTGEGFRAAIDISEEGDLSRALNLGVYRETHEYGMLCAMSQVNVSVNVHHGGDLLEIVGMPSSHGTHVASIAAANFPGEPERNGLAPGAQIISVNIGDGRLGSMETGTAMARALGYVMRAEHYKVDLINMSYGEHAHYCHSGRIGSLMAEVIAKHNVVYVSSAGNDGPALSTVGTPPDIASNTVIGVGAYVSPQMMTAMYSTRDKLPGNSFTWTSRGPTMSGDRGVTVCAPGGAITSVANFTLKGAQLMNGTSMAAPHVCGALALVLSGLRAQALPWSPFGVKRAVANGAQQLREVCPFGQGNGLLDVEATYNHLVTQTERSERDVRFAVHSGPGSDHWYNQGVYLRGKDADTSHEIAIKVEPFFIDHENRPAVDKQNFNMSFSLSCTAPWVHAPTHLNLVYQARSFLIQVDPRGLAPGAHQTFLYAYDSSNPSGGRVWELAITVVRTEALVEGPRPGIQHRLTFTPGHIQRHFVKVPAGATWAEVTAKGTSADLGGKFVLHTVQLVPQQSVRTLEHQKMFTLEQGGADWRYSFPVRGGSDEVLEVCVSKWWASLGSIEIAYSLTFGGVKLGQGPAVTMHGGEGLFRMELASPLRPEEVTPEIKLKSLVQVVRPQAEARLVSLSSSRDTLPGGRATFELQLQYSFNIPKTTDTIISLPALSDLLYESELESQMWMVYDCNKRLLACGDAYSSKWSFKLEKGDYTARAHVRSEGREVVEKFTDTPLLLTTKLPSSLSLDVYRLQSEALVGGKKCGSLSLEPGPLTPVYVAPLPHSEKGVHGKGGSLGQYLLGSVTLPKDEGGKKASVVEFKYVVPDQPAKKKGGSDKKGEKKKNGENAVSNLEEALRDCKISHLPKLSYKSEEGEALYKELCQANLDPTVLSSVHAGRLSNVTSSEAPVDWSVVLQQADTVIKSVDQPALLAYLGLKTDSRDNAAEIKKDMEKVKGYLIDALVAKGEAIIELDSDKEKLLEVYTDLLKFVDATDAKVFSFMWKFFKSQHFTAKAMRLAVKQYEDKQTLDNMKIVLELAKSMNLEHVVRLLEYGKPAMYPTDYQPF